MFELIKYLFILICARLIPHAPNVTPTAALCLLAGSRFNKTLAVIGVTCALLISDIALAFIKGYPAFGAFTFFTVSGWVMLTYLGRFGLTAALFGELAFWLWTNVGVWVSSDLYAHNFNGLLQCYTAALPFLRNSLIASSVLVGVVWVVMHQVERDARANASHSISLS